MITYFVYFAYVYVFKICNFTYPRVLYNKIIIKSKVNSVIFFFRVKFRSTHSIVYGNNNDNDDDYKYDNNNYYIIIITNINRIANPYNDKYLLRRHLNDIDFIVANTIHFRY